MLVITQVHGHYQLNFFCSVFSQSGCPTSISPQASFYLFSTLLFVLSYLTRPSVNICMLMTINFSFLLSPLNSPPTFHTSMPQLILSLSGCLPIFCHLISPKRSFSSLVFLLNFQNLLTPVFSCRLTPPLHQLHQHAILVSFRDVPDSNFDRIPDSWRPDSAGYRIPNKIVYK